MAETFELSAVTREKQGRRKVSSVRKEGKIPGVLYGHGINSTSVEMDGNVFNKVFDAAGESSLISLTVDSSEPVKVLIHDLQRDPLRHIVTHVDFYRVNMDEKIKAEVELVYDGVAPAEKELGGILIKNLDHIEVQCLPGNLPHDIKVDISLLKTFDDVLRVSDLPVIEGVEYLKKETGAVATVSEPRSEEELKALEEEVVVDVDAVEVEGADKTEEGEEKEDTEGEAAGGDDKKDSDSESKGDK